MCVRNQKTKVLVCEKKNRTRVQIQLRGKQIEKVNTFKYLGSVISSDEKHKIKRAKRTC